MCACALGLCSEFMRESVDVHRVDGDEVTSVLHMCDVHDGKRHKNRLTIK